ncbi:type II toxin-antitoxin system PemK/MazF family toxin [Salinarimonas sp. NSM]|uniref:type II toxin-antitoxin system PemK/MazF family toxin n=1 Tax=Salinarimonas sp. NSM TaxID=3458003 RepID=UPI00403699CA
MRRVSPDIQSSGHARPAYGPYLLAGVVTAMQQATVKVGSTEDATVIEALAEILRSDAAHARALREFVTSVSRDQQPRGLQFQPRPGQVLVCHFGLGFRPPEMIKTRPVLVVSPKRRDSVKLCTVVPISSRAPEEVRPYHYRLPQGILPDSKYAEAWIKGDMVATVGCHRLDRLKVGHRRYESPSVPDDVLREARRCVLHATGMHVLTQAW